MRQTEVEGSLATEGRLRCQIDLSGFKPEQRVSDRQAPEMGGCDRHAREAERRGRLVNDRTAVFVRGRLTAGF